MKKRLFILFILTLMVHSVFAADWEQIEDKSYIDISSIKDYNDPYTYIKEQYNRNEKEFWIKSLNDKSSYFTDYEKTYNKKIWYRISKNIIDCNNKTIATKSSAIYDINGKIIDSYDVEHILLNRHDIVPETRAEDWYNIICNYSNNKPKIKIGIVKSTNNNFEKVANSFEPYIDNLYKRIKEQWNNKTYKGNLECTVSFTIARDGRLVHIEVLEPSSNSIFNDEAIKSIKYIAPFKPLPKEFDGQDIEMIFTFIN